jgi:hypothetical protein
MLRRGPSGIEISCPIAKRDVGDSQILVHLAYGGLEGHVRPAASCVRLRTTTFKSSGALRERDVALLGPGSVALLSLRTLPTTATTSRLTCPRCRATTAGQLIASAKYRPPRLADNRHRL